MLSALGSRLSALGSRLSALGSRPDYTIPFTLNKYTFVSGDPLRFIDPDGEQTRDPRAVLAEICASIGQLGRCDEEWQAENELMLERLLEYERRWQEEHPDAYIGLGCGGILKLLPRFGTIYRVRGEYTRSGKPYIGRHGREEPQKTRRSNDGRDRTKAEVVDKYDPKKPQQGRVRKEKQIDEHGGVPNLHNKRNEIAPPRPRPSTPERNPSKAQAPRRE